MLPISHILCDVSFILLPLRCGLHVPSLEGHYWRMWCNWCCVTSAVRSEMWGIFSCSLNHLCLSLSCLGRSPHAWKLLGVQKLKVAPAQRLHVESCDHIRKYIWPSLSPVFCWSNFSHYLIAAALQILSRTSEIFLASWYKQSQAWSPCNVYLIGLS